MIDLTRKSLPNTVCVGGRDFSIYTDFRLWMRFENSIKNLKCGETVNIAYLFKNEKPEYCDIRELLVFSRPVNELPRAIGHEEAVITFDFMIDSDYIYSAFLGQYGIDLIEIEDLHWHKFLALFNGLNESTRMREIMGYRSYKRNTNKDRDIYAELREAWEIGKPLAEDEQHDLDEFNKAFGG